MSKIETFIPKPGDKLIFLGNEKYHTKYLTVGNSYEVYLYHKKHLFFIDDSGEKCFFDALIKSYWEEVKWNN